MTHQQPNVSKPSSHIAMAILTTLCCCSPFGLFAIYKASKVGDYYVMKQYDLAIIASNSARRWCIIGFCTSFIINAIFLILVTFALGASILSALPWLEGIFEFISNMNDLIDSLSGWWNKI